jgi:hypothetical protein
MVSVVASGAVDHGYEPQSVKPKAIKLRRAKTVWLRIRIMCPSGKTCLPEDYCFSELAL